MITDQTQICINLSHAKSELLKAKALLKEISISNIKVEDKKNLEFLDELDKIVDDIKNKIDILLGNNKIYMINGIKKFDNVEEIKE